MFQPIVKDEIFLGHRHTFEGGFAFFGSKNLTKDQLPHIFPQLQFRFLKQVHGSQVIQARPDIKEADGHWSDSENEALVIQTADCLPVMIAAENRILGLHAGWRGIEGQILAEALKLVDNPSHCQVLCGPCISPASFEVGLDVAQRLLESDPKKDNSCLLPHPDPKKKHVDLRKILRHQAEHSGILNPLHFLDIDTFSSPDHFSYRKNGAQAGRIYSFIVRNQSFSKL